MRVALLTSLTVLVAAEALAYDPSMPKSDEMRFLPPYCDVRLNKDYNGPESKAWLAKLGPTWAHIHHYCFALNFVRRADRIYGNPRDRDGQLTVSLPDFDYVINNADPKFILLPEVYVNKGKVLQRLKRWPAAGEHFRKAIDLRPDWPGGYLALSEMYREMGSLEEAQNILDEGIKRNPEAQVLINRRAELK